MTNHKATTFDTITKIKYHEKNSLTLFTIIHFC